MYMNYKFDISAPSVADKVKSLEFVPDKTEGNSFRIQEIVIATTNRDAVASGDKIGFQISTKSQDGNAGLYDINSEYEVWTWQKTNVFTQNDTPTDSQDDPDKAVCIKDKTRSDIVLKSGKKYFFNSIITGQDGADVTTEVKLHAQYQDVNPANLDKLDDAHYNPL